MAGVWWWTLATGHLPLTSSPWPLLHEALPYRMDEIRIGGALSTFAHVAGDLPAMICGVRDDMRQDVHNGASPGFALAVLVCKGLRNVAGSDQVQIVEPHLL